MIALHIIFSTERDNLYISDVKNKKKTDCTAVKGLTILFVLNPQRTIHKEKINSSPTITLIDKGLKLKETLTLMRKIGRDRYRAVLPSPSINNK